MMTGLSISFVEGPVDLFKSQIQVQILREKGVLGAAGGSVAPRPLYRGVVHAASTIVSTYGIRGAYQGLGPTLMRNLPANSVYFGFNEMMRRALTKEGQSTKDLSAPRLLLSGATGGILYWAFTYPIDVIKSSMQADHPDRNLRTYKSIPDCISKLYKEGGMKRFFKGITPCFLRACPANATMWIVFEKTRALLG